MHFVCVTAWINSPIYKLMRSTLIKHYWFLRNYPKWISHSNIQYQLLQIFLRWIMLGLCFFCYYLVATNLGRTPAGQAWTFWMTSFSFFIGAFCLKNYSGTSKHQDLYWPIWIHRYTSCLHKFSMSDFVWSWLVSERV